MISPRWLHHTLTLSAIYGLLWGVLHVIWPQFSFCHVLKAHPESLIHIRAIVGSYIVVNGLTLWALRDPIAWRGWFVGLFVYHLLTSTLVVAGLLDHFLSVGFWLALMLNHVLWIIPAVLMAAWAYGAHWRMEEDLNYLHLSNHLPTETMLDNTGNDLIHLSHQKPVMLVFLRHFGCTFCRHTLQNIKDNKGEFERHGTTLALVHMVDDNIALAELRNYGLEDALRVSDPDCSLYDAFGLEKGDFGQLFGPKVMYRGIVFGIIQKLGIGGFKGDPWQLPGIFLLHKGKVVKAYRHSSAADVPDIGFLSTT